MSTNWPETRRAWKRLKAAVADWRKARWEHATRRIRWLDLTDRFWACREMRQNAFDVLASHMVMRNLSRRYPIATVTGEVVAFRRPQPFETRSGQ